MLAVLNKWQPFRSFSKFTLLEISKLFKPMLLTLHKSIVGNYLLIQKLQVKKQQPKHTEMAAILDLTNPISFKFELSCKPHTHIFMYLLFFVFRIKSASFRKAPNKIKSFKYWFLFQINYTYTSK